ncbi:MAG: T9SS type A sorting domain-containing protein [Ignavibacteria bacterium]|nr:T9SS type A sorting domain-containing protein [Ignavibacteria bacterium]
MKRIKHLPVIFITAFIIYSLGFNIMGGDFINVTLQQIQTKSADSLALGRDKSELEGDSVQFVARVVAPPRVSPANNDFRTMMRGTSSWTCYAQDTANGTFGGIVIRQGSRGPQTALDLIDSGTIIRVKGVVQEFGSTSSSNFANTLTQLALDTATGYTIDILQSGASTKRPAPIPVTISNFANGDYPNGGSINYVDGEKYEGMYIEIRNVTVAGGIGNRQPWSIVDENGNRMYIRDFSNFFSTSPSGDTLRTWAHPTIGTFVEYVRGVIINANNEGAFGSQLPYVIIPIYPNDLSLGNAPPQLSSPTRSPGVPTPPDSVTVSVTATDPSLSTATITDMKVFYRFNNGAFQSKNMPLITGNIYSTKMPPANIGTLVEYFFRAQDNSGGVKLLPTDTNRSTLFYEVRANDSMGIRDVQFCPNNGGRSAFEGFDVRGVEGIVTADTSDIPGINFSSAGGNQTAPRRVYIQDGTGPNSGIWISGNPTDVLRRGDRVRVAGTVEENFSVTRINIASGSGINLISQGNPLPAAVNITSSQINNATQDGDMDVEIWESVLLRLNDPVTINCVNAATGVACTTVDPLPDTTFRRNFGEILVSDASNVNARIELQDGNTTFTNNWDGLQNPPQPGYTLLTKNDIITYVEGVLFYSFSNYKLTPRKNPDFGTVTPVGIVSNVENVNSYYLSQNYPNPFNPSTKITFNIPVSGNISLKIYDMLGREVKSLVNDFRNAGTYNVDFNGADLSSGVYFYKLDAVGRDGNNFVMTKRMVLIK